MLNFTWKALEPAKGGARPAAMLLVGGFWVSGSPFLLCFRHTGWLSLGQRAMHGAGRLRLNADNSRLWLQKLHSCGNSGQQATTTTTDYDCVQVRHLIQSHFLIQLNVEFPHQYMDWMIDIAEIAAESESLLSGIANVWLQIGVSCNVKTCSTSSNPRLAWPAMRCLQSKG